MAGKRQRGNGTWEYVFKRQGVLAKPVYLSFEHEAEGDSFARKAKALLARGIVPAEFSGTTPHDVRSLIERYLEKTVSRPDHDQASSVIKRIGGVRLGRLSYTWVESWIEQMRDEGLAPSTICVMRRLHASMNGRI